MKRSARSEGQVPSRDLRTVGLDPLVQDGDELFFRDLMADFFAAAAIMQSLRRSTAKAFGISATELAVLVAVAKLPPEPTISRIADHLHVAAPNVTTDVGKLVRAGLLAKRADDRDARAIRISFTGAGSELYAAMVPNLREINDRLFAGLSRSEVDRVAAFMRRVVTEGGRILGA